MDFALTMYKPLYFIWWQLKSAKSCQEAVIHPHIFIVHRLIIAAEIGIERRIASSEFRLSNSNSLPMRKVSEFFKAHFAPPGVMSVTFEDLRRTAKSIVHLASSETSVEKFPSANQCSPVCASCKESLGNFACRWRVWEHHPPARASLGRIRTKQHYSLLECSSHRASPCAESCGVSNEKLLL